MRDEATLFVPGVLRGLPSMNGSARGTALVLLVFTIPALVLAMLFAGRGSLAAVLVWIGALAHVLYNSVLFLFGTPFNSLFLLSVAMFSLTLFSLVRVVRQVDVDDLRDRFSATFPVRVIAAYVLLVVVLNSIAWLKGVVPALFSGGSPSFLDGTGLITSPTIESLTVAADQWMGHLADPSSPAIAAFMVPVFLVLAVVGLVPLFVYCRDLATWPTRSGAR